MNIFITDTKNEDEEDGVRMGGWCQDGRTGGSDRELTRNSF